MENVQARYAAAVKVAGTHDVSIEPDGTAWTGTSDDPHIIDASRIDAEMERMQAEAAAKAAADAAATDAAVAHAKSLGFTDEMIAVMYPNLGAQS